MKEITIDCSGIQSRAELHDTFSEALSLPAWYGRNLDALHDCLTDIAEETQLTLLHWETAEAALGSYGQAARKAMRHAAEANPLLEIPL